MITTINKQFMTEAERRASLFRAMHTQPFFNLFTIPTLGAAVKEAQYEDKVDVNKDFYMTEIVGNFDEAFDISATNWDLSVYATRNQGSVYKYQQVTKLPTGFIATEARDASIIFANQQFYDRQFEYCPYLIKAGDRVIAQIKNQVAKALAFDVQIMLKGYYTYPTQYLSPNATRGINESLVRPTRFETWTLNGDNNQDGVIGHTRQKYYSFKNDRFARVILGFGIIDRSPASGLTATVDILDTFRDLKFFNKPIPIEFLGPRVGSSTTEVRDCHIYYLPVEYFWEPFSALQFLIENAVAHGAEGFKLVMHTRTV